MLSQILIYLRLCLIQNLEVPLTREIIKHPTDITPVVRSYLQDFYNEKDKNALNQYVLLIKSLLLANIGLSTTYFSYEATIFRLF